MSDKEATARIQINKLLGAAGWRFFQDGDAPANIRLEPGVTIKSTDLDALGDDFDKTAKGAIADWLRNRNTVEFLGIWERVHNPDFNYGEFATIRSHAGLNSYKISVKDWVAKTNLRGLRASTGRYGGTYAHKDIASEFGMWISAEFKIYLIKEFHRLKDEENDRLKLGWNLQRPVQDQPPHPHRCHSRNAYPVRHHQTAGDAGLCQRSGSSQRRPLRPDRQAMA